MELEEVELIVEDDGCHLLLSPETDEAGYADLQLTGCEAGGMIVTTVESFLTLTIPHQFVEGAVHFENTGETESGRRIDVAIATDRLAYRCEGIFICGAYGSETEGTAEYSGAFELSGHVYESGTTGTYQYGEQTDIWFG